MRIAYIGLGANLPSAAGSPEATLAAAAQRIGALGRLTQVSSLYSTRPVGLADQPDFLNAVVALETDLEPRALLQALMHIEKDFGRDRSVGILNGPRTLDLDILMIQNVSFNEPELQIPHPRLAERAFVLVPLNEIAPGARDPRNGTTVGQYLQRLFLSLAGADHGVKSFESEIWSSTIRRLFGRSSR